MVSMTYIFTATPISIYTILSTICLFSQRYITNKGTIKYQSQKYTFCQFPANARCTRALTILKVMITFLLAVHLLKSYIATVSCGETNDMYCYHGSFTLWKCIILLVLDDFSRLKRSKVIFLQLDVDSLSPVASESEPKPTIVIPEETRPMNIRRRKLSDSFQEIKPTLSSLTNDDDRTYFIVKKTWDIQLAIFVLSFCPLLFRTNYSLALRDMFESTSILTGFASSYGAITGSIAGIVVPLIIQFYSSRYDPELDKVSKISKNNIAESKLLLHSSFILALSFLGCCLAPTLTLFILFQSPISFVNGLSREAFNLIITKRVAKKQVGRVMGTTGSLVAFGRLVAPVLGGIMQEASFRLPIFFSAALSFFATGIIFNYL